MTPTEAHAAAVEEAANAADGLLTRSGIPRTVATEHLGLNLSEHIITAYLAAMERAEFVMVPTRATHDQVAAAQELWGWGLLRILQFYRTMVAARPAYV